MKVLLDACVWGPAALEITRAGHEVVTCSDWGRDPGDEALIRRAHEESRVLVTLDKDFGELAIVRRIPHAGIVRLVDISARDQGRICGLILERYAEDLSLGAIVTVEQTRVRIRPGDRPQE